MSLRDRIKWTKQNKWCPLPGTLLVLRHPSSYSKFESICFPCNPGSQENKTWVTPKEIYERVPVLCVGASNPYCVKVLINDRFYLIFLDDIDYMV